jgi:hypothetical protein
MSLRKNISAGLISARGRICNSLQKDFFSSSAAARIRTISRCTRGGRIERITIELAGNAALPDLSAIAAEVRGSFVPDLLRRVGRRVRSGRDLQ